MRWPERPSPSTVSIGVHDLAASPSRAAAGQGEKTAFLAGAPDGDPRRRDRRLRRCLAFLVAALLLAPRPAHTQEIGSIAALDGTVEIGRAGAWTPAAIGTAVREGDTLRTGRPGRVRVFFNEDSVLNAADETEVQIAAYAAPGAASPQVRMRIARGKARAVVAEIYAQGSARFDIETPTAIATVKGTEFVIAFDPVADTSNVVGINNRVAVHGTIDPVAHGVEITARELTTIARGGYPSPPQLLDEPTFRQYLEGLDFIGDGHAESQTVDLPLFHGADIPPEDRSAMLPPVAGFLPGAPLSPTSGPLTEGEQAIQDVLKGRDPAGIIGSSPPVVVSPTGQIGVTF